MEKLLTIILSTLIYIFVYRIFIICDMKQHLAVIWPITVAVLFLVLVLYILPAELISFISANCTRKHSSGQGSRNSCRR